MTASNPRVMDRDTEQEIIRCAYARQILAVFGVSDRRIEAAFASIAHQDGRWTEGRKFRCRVEQLLLTLPVFRKVGLQRDAAAKGSDTQPRQEMRGRTRR
jgi:hypothetical protein